MVGVTCVPKEEGAEKTSGEQRESLGNHLQETLKVQFSGPSIWLLLTVAPLPPQPPPTPTGISGNSSVLPH